MGIKVIIEKLELINWGSYYEREEIQFSMDEERNVTYIVGKNSTGKTKLFQAILWVLFDKIEEFPDKVNSKRKMDGEEFEVEVVIHLITESTTNKTKHKYKITRKAKFSGYKFLEENWSIKYSHLRSRNYQEMNLKEFKHMIDEYIPYGPRDFYFLDGENLVNIFLRNIELVKNLALAQSRIPILNEIKDFLNKEIDISYSFSSKISSKDNLLSRHYETIQRHHRKKEDLSKNIKKMRESLNQVEMEILSYEEQLQNVNMDVFLERESLNTELAAFKENKGKIEEKLDNLLKEVGIQILLEDIFKECLQDLTARMEKDEIKNIISIPNHLIDSILKRKECVCGTIINSESQKILERYRGRKDSEVTLYNEINNFQRELSEELIQINEGKGNLTNLLGELQILDLKIKNQNGKLERIGPIKGRDEIKSLLDKLNQSIRKKADLETSIVDSQNNIEKEENAISRVEKNIKKAKSELKNRMEDIDVEKLDKELQKIDHYRQFLLELVKILKLLINMVEEYIKTSIKKDVDRRFLEFIWNEEEWREIEIDNEWKFFAIHRNNSRIPSTELSKGQRHVLGIAI